MDITDIYIYTTDITYLEFGPMAIPGTNLLEVPIIYNAYVSKGIYHQNMALYGIVMYSSSIFGILEISHWSNGKNQLFSRNLAGGFSGFSTAIDEKGSSSRQGDGWLSSPHYLSLREALNEPISVSKMGQKLVPGKAIHLNN